MLLERSCSISLVISTELMMLLYESIRTERVVLLGSLMTTVTLLW